jgi:hypothetical protein
VNLSYYIYYKVPPANAASAFAAVAALQRDLAMATGIVGRLLRRRDDPTTWMEVYERVTDAASFEDKLRELADAQAVEDWLAPGDTRRQEIFQSF